MIPRHEDSKDRVIKQNTAPHVKMGLNGETQILSV